MLIHGPIFESNLNFGQKSLILVKKYMIISNFYRNNSKIGQFSFQVLRFKTLILGPKASSSLKKIRTPTLGQNSKEFDTKNSEISEFLWVLFFNQVLQCLIMLAGTLAQWVQWIGAWSLQVAKSQKNACHVMIYRQFSVHSSVNLRLVIPNK